MHAQAVRPWGSVACYVTNSMAIHFEPWKVPSLGSILWLKSKPKFVQCHGTRHLRVGLVYLPPKRSTSEQRCDTQPNLEQLQQDVTGIAAYNGLVLLTKDFNARAGEAADLLDADIAGNLLDTTLQPATCTPLPLRNSVWQRRDGCRHPSHHDSLSVVDHFITSTPSLA